jgi:hypothetical protein
MVINTDQERKKEREKERKKEKKKKFIFSSLGKLRFDIAESKYDNQNPI